MYSQFLSERKPPNISALLHICQLCFPLRTDDWGGSKKGPKASLSAKSWANSSFLQGPKMRMRESAFYLMGEASCYNPRPRHGVISRHSCLSMWRRPGSLFCPGGCSRGTHFCLVQGGWHTTHVCGGGGPVEDEGVLLSLCPPRSTQKERPWHPQATGQTTLQKWKLLYTI